MKEIPDIAKKKKKSKIELNKGKEDERDFLKFGGSPPELFPDFSNFRGLKRKEQQREILQSLKETIKTGKKKEEK